MIKIARDCKKHNDDYIVPVELPDGRQITVLIPFSKRKKEGFDQGVRDGEIYGLNLFTDGHFRR